MRSSGVGHENFYKYGQVSFFVTKLKVLPAWFRAQYIKQEKGY